MERIQNEQNKGLEKLIREMREPNLITEAQIAIVERIAKAVYSQIDLEGLNIKNIKNKEAAISRLESSKTASIATFCSWLSTDEPVSDVDKRKRFFCMHIATQMNLQ